MLRVTSAVLYMLISHAMGVIVYRLPCIMLPKQCNDDAPPVHWFRCALFPVRWERVLQVVGVSLVSLCGRRYTKKAD